MADSWTGSSYSYRDMGSFCHQVFKQNVIPAITLSFFAALSQPCKKKTSDGSFSCRTPLGGYVPVLFPTYFNLCLTAAHITLNCAFRSSTRKSLSVIFGVWMCPWGVVCLRQAYSFSFSSIIAYCIREEALTSMQHRGRFASMWAFPSLRKKKKKNILCDNYWIVFRPLLWFKVCVTDSFGWEPAQFAKQVIPLCS